MAESVTFPAKVTFTQDVSAIGLPTVQATFEVDDEVKALPLPSGPDGDEGPRGIPLATWIRQDPPIANAAARPTGLGASDIGKWWHRLDDNGMDTWTDIGWVHCANCVGATGPIAYPTFVEVAETISLPKLRFGAMQITGTATELEAKVTAPAGPKGIKGDPGASTALLTRTDFDNTHGPVQRSMFAWRNRSNIVQLSKTGKFQNQPFPNGYGPWAKAGNDFPGDIAGAQVDMFDLISIDIPALPFRWRPVCRGFVNVYTSAVTPIGYPIVWARLNSTQGQIVGFGGALNTKVEAVWPVSVRPYYSEIAAFDKTGLYPQASMSPSSTACTVAPYETATIYLRVERAYASATSGTHIGFQRAGNYASPAPYFEVRAMPVSL